LNNLVSKAMPDALAEILGQIRKLPPVNDDLAPYL